MPITENLIDHRILIVLDPVTGALRGAHEDKLTALMDGETQRGVIPTNGVPLDAATLATALPTQAALAAQVQSLTDQVSTMTTDLATRTTERDAAVTAKVSSETTVADQQTQIATLTAQLTEANQTRATAEQTKTSTEAALAAMTTERDTATAALSAANAQIATLQDQINGVATVDENGVPQRVSPYQARQALHAAGLLDAIEAAIATADRSVQIAWEYALTIERTSPLIATMTPALGLTEQQVDDLFRAAAQIT